MSAAMIAANSTRGLRKLSKAEEKQAKAGNAGKHMQNAAGHALRLRKNNGPTPKRRRTKVTKVASTRSKPRARRARVAHAPKTSADAVRSPVLDPMLIDLDGYESLPDGAATDLQVQYDNQHVVSLVGASPYLPIEVPPAFYGNPFDTSLITYDQFAPTFVPSMSAYGMESMLGEQALYPGDDFIDWYGGESDGWMEEMWKEK